MSLFIYNNEKTKNHSVVTAMIASEIRAAIQNWRKANKLPIDYRIPTLYVFFEADIIKTALIEGITDVGTKVHLFETCLVDKVEFIDPVELPDSSKKDIDLHHDFVFWSPLGGTFGYSDCLHNNTPNIQKELDTCIKDCLYNHYI